jgi:hypothetical protein
VLKQLLTNVMLYWLTGTANSSARPYYETAHATPGWTAPSRQIGELTKCLDLIRYKVGVYEDRLSQGTAHHPSNTSPSSENRGHNA